VVGIIDVELDVEVMDVVEEEDVELEVVEAQVSLNMDATVSLMCGAQVAKAQSVEKRIP
jgi:hypothetical protein